MDFLATLLRNSRRPEECQDSRDEQQARTQAEDNGAEHHLHERPENHGRRHGHRKDAQVCGEAPQNHCGPHPRESHLHALYPCLAGHILEAVNEVQGIVHTQANRHDQIRHGDGIESDAGHMHHAKQEDINDHNGAGYNHAGFEVAHEHEAYENDAG